MRYRQYPPRRVQRPAVDGSGGGGEGKVAGGAMRRLKIRPGIRSANHRGHLHIGQRDTGIDMNINAFYIICSNAVCVSSTIRRRIHKEQATNLRTQPGFNQLLLAAGIIIPIKYPQVRPARISRPVQRYNSCISIDLRCNSIPRYRCAKRGIE